jgi:hypothetical protein
MKHLLALAFGLAGCLPAYDDLLRVGGPVVDMAGPTDGGVDGAMACAPSGKFVAAIARSLEFNDVASGVSVHLDGYPDAAFTSPPSDGNGHYAIPIPNCVFGKMGRYLVFEGTNFTVMAGTYPILRSWVAPARFGKTELLATDGTPTHFWANLPDMTSGIRNVVASELAAASKIPDATKFATDFSIAYGPVASEVGTIDRYNNYKVQIIDGGTTLDNTNCMPTQQCCVYYMSGEYFDWKAGRTGPTFIKLGDTSANGYFYSVVCPAKGAKVGDLAGELTLHQAAPTSTLKDAFGNSPSIDFPDIVIPRVVGNGVHVEWLIFQ